MAPRRGRAQRGRADQRIVALRQRPCGDNPTLASARAAVGARAQIRRRADHSTAPGPPRRRRGAGWRGDRWPGEVERDARHLRMAERPRATLESLQIASSGRVTPPRDRERCGGTRAATFATVPASAAPWPRRGRTPAAARSARHGRRATRFSTRTPPPRDTGSMFVGMRSHIHEMRRPDARPGRPSRPRRRGRSRTGDPCYAGCGVRNVWSDGYHGPPGTRRAQRLEGRSPPKWATIVPAERAIAGNLGNELTTYRPEGDHHQLCRRRHARDRGRRHSQEPSRRSRVAPRPHGTLVVRHAGGARRPPCPHDPRPPRRPSAPDLIGSRLWQSAVRSANRPRARRAESRHRESGNSRPPSGHEQRWSVTRPARPRRTSPTPTRMDPTQRGARVESLAPPRSRTARDHETPGDQGQRISRLPGQPRGRHSLSSPRYGVARQAASGGDDDAETACFGHIARSRTVASDIDVMGSRRGTTAFHWLQRWT